MSRKVAIALRMEPEKAEKIREYCSHFEASMPEVITGLVMYAMDHAPIVKTGVMLDLGEHGKIPMGEPKNLRGPRPGSKNRTK